MRRVPPEVVSPRITPFDITFRLQMMSICVSILGSERKTPENASRHLCKAELALNRVLKL